MNDTEELPAFTDAPDEEESRQLTKLGHELLAVDTDIATLEQKLETAKKRRQELTTKDLPDYMKKIGQDKLGLPEFEVDLVLENYYHANIKADWPDDQRDRAFNYLVERGDGDLIKTKIEMYFGRSEIWKVKWLLATINLLREKLAEQDVPVPESIPDPLVSMAVPWNTLTAFVKEQVEAGASLDLDIIGATVGQIVKIKKRKK